MNRRKTARAVPKKHSGRPVRSPLSGHRMPDLHAYLTAHIRDHFRVIVENIPGAVAGRDPEFVHRLRVASRRLRASLNIYIRFFGAGPSLDEVCDGVRNLTRRLGRIRELDIALWYLRSVDSPIPTKDRNAARAMLELPVSRILDRTRRKRLNGLEPSTFETLRQEFLENDMGMIPPRGRPAPKGRQSAAVVRRDTKMAASMVERRMSRARRQYLKVRGIGDTGRLHRFRIAMKKLRYAVEILLPFLPESWKDRLIKIKKLQDVLGRIHDDHVTAQMYRRVSGSLKGPGRVSARKACEALSSDNEVQYARLGFIRLAWMA